MQINNLEEFVKYLTAEIHQRIPNSLVIWYDSVTCEGDLAWQNELNAENRYILNQICQEFNLYFVKVVDCKYGYNSSHCRAVTKISSCLVYVLSSIGREFKG